MFKLWAFIGIMFQVKSFHFHLVKKFHIIARCAGREFDWFPLLLFAFASTVFLLDVGSAGFDNKLPTKYVPKLYGMPLSS